MDPVVRRGLVGAGLAALAASPMAARARPGETQDNAAIRKKFLDNFRNFPGTQAIRIWAPATGSKPEFTLQVNSDRQLFVGSAIKAFVLCARMQQIERTTANVADVLVKNQLVLDESVWTADSATFNPPNLAGKVTERTTMEAMILHSDNTATDMMLKQTGPENVRAFLRQAGLQKSLIPDSTRAFFGYLLGVPEPTRFTWADLLASDDKPIVNPPLNQVESLASSADDLVSFYSRSLSGEFFNHPETLKQYRNVLRIGDVINIVFPPNVGGFAKGGSIDVRGFHTLCIPGAMFFDDRWVYLALIINWNAPAETDPATVSRYATAVSRALAGLVDDLR